MEWVKDKGHGGGGLEDYNNGLKQLQTDEVSSLRIFAELKLQGTSHKWYWKHKTKSLPKVGHVPRQIKLEWQGAKASVYKWTRNKLPHTYTHT